VRRTEHPPPPGQGAVRSEAVDLAPLGEGGDTSESDAGDGDGILQVEVALKKGKRSRGGLANAGRARSRNRTSNTKRRRLDCPVEGCSGQVIDLRRHQQDCHRNELPRWEVDRLLRDLSD
jgi:hypothetical protein